MDRRNRLLWAALSLAVGCAAISGLLLGAGVFGSAATRTPLLPEPLVSAWSELGVWAPAWVAVLGLLLAWLGWRLLRAELRRGGQIALDDLELPTGRDMQRAAGWTVVRGPALARGMGTDLQRVPGVERAQVGLFGSPRQPTLRAQLDVNSADLMGLRKQVTRCLERFTATAGTSPHTVDITFRLVPRGTAPRVS